MPNVLWLRQKRGKTPPNEQRTTAVSCMHGCPAGSGEPLGFPAWPPLTRLGGAVEQPDSLINRVESSVVEGYDASNETARMLPGFPKTISGDISIFDAKNPDGRVVS
ncbi:putative homoaconitase [Rosellinia necatrix]|uniref:Putative homoaconitase n=1 Tax=Rosellinia necatrix TaxID=77044 RepID=A0A1S8A911_ROSNE|nr:putative homoaconitase [Rosellinia necatrix]